MTGRLMIGAGMTMKRLLLSSLTLFVAACGADDPTQVMVRIRADSTVAAAEGTLTITITDNDGSDREIVLTVGDDGDYPFVLALAPRANDAAREWGVEIELESPTLTLTHRANGVYDEGRVAVYDVLLTAQCANVDCSEDMTCVGGACRSARVDPSELPDYDEPGVGIVDAGAAPRDSGTAMDANVDGNVDVDADVEMDADIEMDADVLADAQRDVAMEIDAGVDATSDTGGGVDAAMDSGSDTGSPTCLSPFCLGIATEDFSSTMQGTGTVMWGYTADDRSHPRLSYGPLAPDTIYAAPAWSDLDAPPAIVACGSSTAGRCLEADGKLIFETDGQSSGADPVLTFVAPNDGTYLVRADLQALAGTARVTIGRNGIYDSVAEVELTPPASQRLTATMELFAGERGVVLVSPAEAGPASVALDVQVGEAPATAPLRDCQLAMRFSEADPLALECSTGAVTFANLNISPAEDMTSAIPGPAPVMGNARDFPLDSAMRLDGAELDWSGDFTIQLWARVDFVSHFETEIFTNIYGPELGGVEIGLEPRDIFSTNMGDIDVLFAYYIFPKPDAFDDSSLICDRGDTGTDPCCDDTSCGANIVTPVQAGWHFYRLVRDTANNEMRLCVDGQEMGTGVLPGDADISTTIDPKLATTAFGFSEPTFNGAIDDLRVISRALPCGAP